MKRSAGRIFITTLLAVCMMAALSITATAADEWYSSFEWDKATYDLGTGNTGKVVIEFDAKPLVVGDLCVGYVDSSTNPTGWAELNIIVRFGDGYATIMDARNGAEYGYENEIEVEVDKTYHVKIVTDPSEGKYDAWVDDVLLAKDYEYRLLAPEIDDVGKLVLIAGLEEQDEKFVVTNHTISPYTEPVSPTTFDGGILTIALVGAGSGLAALLLRRKKR